MSHTRGEIHLFVQFYNDKNPERNAENEKCIDMNLANPFISFVHLMTEPQTVLPERFINHPKAVVTLTEARLTFRVALENAEISVPIGDVMMISNLDIIFDHTSPWKSTFSDIFKEQPPRTAVVLSRHEMNSAGDVWCDPNIMTGWSQDVWILQKMENVPFVPPEILENFEFCVGNCPGCDGYMAYLWREVCKYRVVNLGLKLKVFHYDRCRGHAGGNMCFSAATDMTAKNALDALSDSERLKTHVCPYADPFKNEDANCWKRGPHFHNVSKTDDRDLQKTQLQEMIKGVSHSSVTLKERNHMLRLCVHIMKEKQIYFEIPENCPDAAFLYAHWANNLRIQHKYEEAFPIALKALKETWTEEECTENEAYDYFRYHIMGIVGFYTAQGKGQGYEAVLQAIRAKNGLSVDMNNLTFYMPLFPLPPQIEISPTQNPRVIFGFWTGDSPMTSKRLENLYALRTVPEVSHLLITPQNLDLWVKASNSSLHEAYPFLSETHKADYLRMFFMHHFGGGYADIKFPRGSWKKAFDDLENDPEKWMNGYSEFEARGVAHPDYRQHFKDLNGNGAFIFKANTTLTQEWKDQVHAFLDAKLPQLKLCPAKNAHDCAEKNSGYPIEWNEMLGRILHPLMYKYKARLFHSVPLLVFENYR